MTGNRLAGRTIVAAVPLILVNIVAFAGQLAFLRAHLPWPLAGQVVMAVALESVAVFLALHAHVAALANDSALRLRLASYGFAAVIGAMNYSHYAAPGWRPTFPAAAVGLMSAASPWLWGVHSRRVSRDQLIERGLVEPHALRLGMTRWSWHPLRSARVMYHATWAGVTDPREAISSWPATASRVRPGMQPANALEVHPAGAPETASQPALEDAGRPALTAAPGKRTRSASGGRTRSASKPVSDTAAEMHFAADLAAGQVPSVRRIQRELHVGQARAQLIRQHLARQAFST